MYGPALAKPLQFQATTESDVVHCGMLVVGICGSTHQWTYVCACGILMRMRCQLKNARTLSLAWECINEAFPRNIPQSNPLRGCKRFIKATRKYSHFRGFINPCKYFVASFQDVVYAYNIYMCMPVSACATFRLVRQRPHPICAHNPTAISKCQSIERLPWLMCCAGLRLYYSRC